MSESEINNLIAEYNAVEAEQNQRRLELFRLLEARTGFRRVVFAGRRQIWSNCWGLEERLSKPAFVDMMDQSVLSVEPGAEADPG